MVSFALQGTDWEMLLEMKARTQIAVTGIDRSSGAEFPLMNVADCYNVSI